jgi:mono/diheme cytochrome c family protein
VKQTFVAWLTFSLWLVCIIEAPSAFGDEKDVARKVTAEEATFYRDKVAPILTARCFSCHGPESELKGGLFLGARAGILEGGESGAAVDLKEPKDSLLVDAINYQTYEMPPKEKLPADQIQVLTKWVEMGVPIPADAETERPASNKLIPPKVTEETKQFWSFLPVANPEVPDVMDGDWVQNPIDHFVLAKLEQAGLAPNPRASRTQLIRRAYYDLIGLPPSIEQVEAFVNDESPDAFENVIDHLLESKHYGERWGRHWLDLVRYAESNSYERDGDKPHIWRYRDYVIRSFNEDKPYTQFIKEQLAGDEFTARTPDSIVATGYYRLGIWDDEPVSQKMALYDDLDDIVMTTSQVFLGMTMNCARCHDHKLDPIPQKDYYRFLSFFHGIRRYGVRGFDTVEDASIGPIAVTAEQEHTAAVRSKLDRELAEVNRKIDQVNRRLRELMTPPEKEDFKAVEVRVDIAKKYAGKGLAKAQAKDYIKAMARRREIEETRPDEIAKALIVKEVGAVPRETFVLVRGNANVPGEKVEPGFPSILSPPAPIVTLPESGKSSGRRLALANWIASRDNKMTARVMVNRMWQHHFGRGIVRSSNNFGSAGIRPTHPELLDWLATSFMDTGWKLKSMHKTIMMSSAYQMSSQASEMGLEKDPANHLIWRFDMRRLSAEELRDSILAANGSLNPKMGGPSFYPLIPAEVLAGQSRPGAGWGNSSPEERSRRAVYIFIKRSLLDPLMADFDFADVDATCPVRFVTTQPTQSLALLNSEFANRQAGIFADHLEDEVGDDPAAQVRLGLTKITQRRPTEDEVDRGVAFLDGLKEENVPADEALRYFCLLAYNMNEFLYLD